MDGRASNDRPVGWVRVHLLFNGVYHRRICSREKEKYIRRKRVERMFRRQRNNDPNNHDKIYKCLFTRNTREKNLKTTNSIQAASGCTHRTVAAISFEEREFLTGSDRNIIINIINILRSI